jgi:hypothetical protein
MACRKHVQVCVTAMFRAHLGVGGGVGSTCVKEIESNVLTDSLIAGAGP